MKNHLFFLLLLVCFVNLKSQNPIQTFYFDFGSQTPAQGSLTNGADENQHHWNNITNDATGNKYASSGSLFPSLINSENQATDYTLVLNSRFSTNGKSSGGGFLSPLKDNLGDLAIVSATEDYFFIEADENNSSMTFNGLNPERGYKFTIFASRSNTQTRIGIYTIKGYNTFEGELQAAGADLGGQGVNQNVKDLCISELVYPNEEGIIKLTVSRKTGSYIPLNILKLEEFEGGEKPSEEIIYTTLLFSGSASESNVDTKMRMVSKDESYTNKFELFTSLRAGEFALKGISQNGQTISLGQGITTGTIGISNSPIVNTYEGEAYIEVDLMKNTYKITPINDWSLVGSVVNGWNPEKGESIPYQGNGVWSGRVELNGITEVSDRERFVFIMNKSWNYQMKRIKGTQNQVGFASQGYSVEDINLNHGSYTVRLDLRNYEYSIECDCINEYKISVMGSSVANGEGAENNKGYAYMYGNLLEKRFEEQAGQYPWFTSGISIGGNSTLNLLGRFNDLVHDCGTYVIYGLSLGNEGIHGHADPEMIFNQYRDNMQLLIQKARAINKYPLIMNNYTRGDFDEKDYAYVKKMNLLIHEWDLPSINMLGAIDNGNGKWADGYQNGSDIYHPTTEGHREFLYAMVPSLFDAIEKGKAQPERAVNTSYLLGNGNTLEFSPEEIVHPFTLAFKVKGNMTGVLASFKHGEADHYLMQNTDGVVLYQTSGGELLRGATKVSDNEWHTVTLSHYYAQGRTLLYVDGIFQGEVREKLVPKLFRIGDSDKNVSRLFSELFFYRSAMNQEEIQKLLEGRMLKSSLEIYAPIDDQTNNIDNLAQSTNTLTLKTSPTDLTIIETKDLFIHIFKGGLQINVDRSTRIRLYANTGILLEDQVVDNELLIEGLMGGIYFLNGNKLLIY